MMLVKATLGNWIYVLLGLVWVAYSIHKGLQKKNGGVGNQNMKPERKTSFFDAFLQEMTGESPVSEPHSPVSESVLDEVTTLPQNSAESFDSDFSFDESIIKEKKEEPFEATKRDLSASLTESEKQVEKTQITKRTNGKKIDLRKAVIYSVILERYSF